MLISVDSFLLKFIHRVEGQLFTPDVLVYLLTAAILCLYCRYVTEKESPQHQNRDTLFLLMAKSDNAFLHTEDAKKFETD